MRALPPLWASAVFSFRPTPQLRHPNIVGFVDFCEDKDYYYIVMELVEGGELLAHVGGKVRDFSCWAACQD